MVGVVSVVRADIDPPKEWPYQRQQEFVEEQLAEVRLLLGEPTAVIDSGRGRWAYLKLSESIPKDNARGLNQALHTLTKSTDWRSYNPAQWVRLPGSVNEKTGLSALVSDLNPDRLFDPVELDVLLREFMPSKKAKQKGSGASRDFPWTAEKLEKVVCLRLRVSAGRSRSTWSYHLRLRSRKIVGVVPGIRWR